MTVSHFLDALDLLSAEPSIAAREAAHAFYEHHRQAMDDGAAVLRPQVEDPTTDTVVQRPAAATSPRI